MVTTSVYVRNSPAFTLAAALVPTFRSAICCTVVWIEVRFVLVMGSNSSPTTLALFVMTVLFAKVVVIGSAMVTADDVPGGIVPSAQMTAPPVAAQLPDAEPKANREGRISVTTTLLAVDGPAFETVTV